MHRSAGLFGTREDVIMGGYTLVLGGHGSGKSVFAEDLFSEHTETKYYMATLMVCDREGEERVLSHRRQREGKGFITVERLQDVEKAKIKPGSCVLLECATNLLANEMFEGGLGCEAAVDKCMKSIGALAAAASFMVVVATDPKDWQAEGEETEEFARAQILLNEALTAEADRVYRM